MRLNVSRSPYLDNRLWATCRVRFHSITSDPRVHVWGGVDPLSLGGSERGLPWIVLKDLCHGERILSNIEAKLSILYGRFDTQTTLSLLMMSTVLVCY